MLKLRVDSADGRSGEREVAGDVLVVGRSTRADLVLADPAVSREHARLYREDDAWFLRDLGSHFGTRVNGEPVTAVRRLAQGDSIGIGGFTLVVDLGAPSADPSPDDSTVYHSAQDVLAGSLEGAGSDSPGARRTAERLRVLMEVNQALARSISLEELLDLVLERAFELLRPQFGIDIVSASVRRELVRQEAEHIEEVLTVLADKVDEFDPKNKSYKTYVDNGKMTTTAQNQWKLQTDKAVVAARIAQTAANYLILLYKQNEADFASKIKEAEAKKAQIDGQIAGLIKDRDRKFLND